MGIVIRTVTIAWQKVLRVSLLTAYYFLRPYSLIIQDGILEMDDPQFFQKFQRLNTKGAAFRVNHRSWWKEEQPGPEEYQEARKNLERAGWEVDYIITHCAPTSIQNELLQALSKPDELTDFLEEVRLRCQFQYHFFGHYHGDLVIRQKYVLLYKQILRLK